MAVEFLLVVGSAIMMFLTLLIVLISPVIISKVKELLDSRRNKRIKRDKRNRTILYVVMVAFAVWLLSKRFSKDDIKDLLGLHKFDESEEVNEND